MAAVININQLRIVPIRNAAIPDEGPKCVPIPLDFSALETYSLDLSNVQQRAFISMVQTLYVDNSASDAVLTISVAANNSGQTIKVKGRKQGYYPILCGNPVTLTFAQTGGAAGVLVFLVNVPVPPGEWDSQ